MRIEADPDQGRRNARRSPPNRPQVGRRPIGPQKEYARRPVSRVLFRPKGRRRSFLWTDHCWSVLATYPDIQGGEPLRADPRDVPIWSCSRRGLPCRRRCRLRGGLLPHPFTLTGLARPEVCFLWRYPSGRPGRKLSAAFSPWSPDFPRRTRSPPRPPGRLTRR